jgi:hypothetical protein
VGCDRDRPRDRLLVHGTQRGRTVRRRHRADRVRRLHPRIHRDHMGPEPTTWDPNQRRAYSDDAPNRPGSSPTSSSSTGAPEAAPSLHAVRQAVPPLRRLGSRIRRHDQGQRAVLPHSRRVPHALPRRTATPITASGPTGTGITWTVLHLELGFTGPAMATRSGSPPQG